MGGSRHALFLFSFLCFWTKESGAVTKFVQRGGDVLLQLKMNVTLGEDQDFFWKIEKVKFLKMTHDKKHFLYRLKERVEFYPHNQSLLIKNLTLADSQVYTAVVSGEKDIVVAEYTIKVQDAVPPVVLNVSSVSLGGDSCNVTVTCNAESSAINSSFRCFHQTCNQEGGEQSEDTLSDSTLRLSLNGNIISCNHSNQVNWTHDMTEIQHFCPFKPGPSPWIWVVIGVAVCVLILALIGSLVCYRKRTRASRQIMSPTNTEYETPKEIFQARTRIQNDTEDQLASPASIYSLAGHADILCEMTNMPESVYAQVKKPSKVNHTQINHLNG